MKIDERKTKILQAIIEDYISTGVPVGSRTLSKKYNLGLSSATIRNEMADMEELGYLVQPHTSAGRIPSDRGYRLYVDKLIQGTSLSKEEEDIINSYLVCSNVYEFDEIMKQTAKVLSDLTGLTSVVNTPSIEKSFLKSITLIPINKSEILLTIITDKLSIRQKVVHISREIKSTVLSKMNSVINEAFKEVPSEGFTEEFLKRLENIAKEDEEVFNSLIENIKDSLVEENTSNIYIEGTVNILNFPEYHDIEKAKDFLEFVKDSNNLKGMLEINDKFSVMIGEENKIEGAKDCSVITASYGYNGKNLGTIGVIGPKRINYPKVISLLETLSNNLNEFIQKSHKD